jgi:undecaprenyl-diphosphatase
LGSGLLEFYSSLEYIQFDGLVNLAIATIVSAISGYVTIAFLLSFLKKNSTMVFVFYRIAIGIIVFALISNGVITP